MSTSLLVSLLIVGATAAAEDEHPFDCGPNSLYILSKLSGCRASLDTIKKGLPSRDPDGHSMAELQSAARGFGLSLRGGHMDKDDVPLDRPVIAYMKIGGAGHFVVLCPVGVTGKMVQLLDPPSSPAVVDYDRLLNGSAWTGRVLIPVSAWERSMPWVLSIFLFSCVGLSLIIFKRHLGRRHDQAGPDHPEHRPDVH